MNTIACIASPHPSRACQAALAMACQLGDGVSITVLSAGPEPETTAFRDSRLINVTRAVHLCDPALANADAFVLGTVLAESARWLQGELIFAGTASDDEGRGLVPAMLAQHLGAHILSDVENVFFDGAEPKEIIAVCHAGGQRLRLAFKLPVVLTVAPALPLSETPPAEPIAPPQVEYLTLAQLGIEASQLVPMPDLLGSLENKKSKLKILGSVDALVAHWLGNT
jgi:electron transfer flavoprotein beta subunit